MSEISIVPAYSPRVEPTPLQTEAVMQNRQEQLLPISKILSFTQDPNVQAKLQSVNTLKYFQVMSHLHQTPTVYYFYALEAVWFLGMLIFRAWKKFNSKKFLETIWVQFYTTVIYFVGASVLIPLLFLSSEDRQIISEILSNR